VRQLPKLVIPYVPGILADETRTFGEEHQAAFEDVGDDDEAYFRLISRLWSDRRSFLIVEHDIVPSAEQYHEMLICPEPWCAGVHKLHDAAEEIWSLGRMKFGSALLRAHYGADIEDHSGEPDGGAMLARVLGHDRRWQRVDLALYTVLRMGGFPESHLHSPAGRNLHHAMEAAANGIS
jgi:hypothetical protein